MNTSLEISKIEKKVITKKNRFIFLKEDALEIKRVFEKKNILILGAAGSIGASFTIYLLKNFSYFNKIFLLDKNENDLTDLNRTVASLNKNLNIEYICSDLNEFNLNYFSQKNKINTLLNFAAIKHVRSEENIDSIAYMLRTNALNFLPQKKNYLEKVFSISTDKTVNPQSILGVSKDLMEKKLFNFSKKHKVFVSSARFANVSFSNGSILKYAYENLITNKVFGIPSEIRRFFITHEEAVHLCLKSLLDRNNNMIIIPSPLILKKDISIKNMVLKIAKLLKKKVKFESQIQKVNSGRINKILLTKPNTHGQKIYEELFHKKENILRDQDPTIIKVQMISKKINIDKFIQKVLKTRDIFKFKKKIKKEYKQYLIKKNLTVLSKSI
jgi:FlaA1/EpsC-like NDP-sugar epimerase